MSVFQKGMHPGAVWKKIDLQVHTPRDPQWQGSPNLPGGTDSSEQARADWADRFVAECIARGLHAIAITDHHDLCMIEYVRAAIARRTDPDNKPWLFPGMEVTCRDAVQCLVVFDSDSEPPVWRRLFGGHLQNIAEPEQHAATNPQATECGKDIEAFIEGVVADTPLSERCIILPHASNEGAHKSMLRQGFGPRFANLPFDGVYTDKPFDGLQEGTKRKIYGEINEWGRRRRGIIPTGDNRHQNFDRLGDRPCWIRLGEPTSEALRQALLADAARISYHPPALPSHRILELRINSSLTGANFRLAFNDGFNALIGGRGSGKSSLLEYLRFGLGRSAIDTFPDDDSHRQRDQALIEQTLSPGSVSVVLERDGTRETWTRDGRTRDLLEITLPDGSSEVLTIDAAQQRFRARAFYQKQLSTIVTDREHAAEQITGIAAAEYVDKRRLLERDIASAQRAVTAAYQRMVEYWVADSEHAQSKAAVTDLSRRRDAVRDKIKDSGLSAESQQTIDEAPNYRLANTLLREAIEKAEHDIKSLHQFRTTFSSLSATQWAPFTSKFGELVPLEAAVASTQASVDKGIAVATAALQGFKRQALEVAQEFIERSRAFDERHKAAIDEQIATSELIKEAERLSTEQETAMAGERSSRARKEALSDAMRQLLESRGNLSEKVSELRQVLAEAAAQVEKMSDNALRASAAREEKPLALLEAYTSIFEGNRIRDVQTKCEDQVQKIVASDEWDIVCDVILSIRREQIRAGATSGELPHTVPHDLQRIFTDPLTPQQMRQVYEKITDASVVRFLCAYANDFINFEYRDGKEFIPFAQASPGQQASALLNLLLNQEAGTLIIDQPEDDLDNRVIMNIARLLQTTKRKRQLIFATHNPNLVVNGDADKIIALMPGVPDPSHGGDDSRISVHVDGAIETSTVRDAVTETMEGGQKAFELRSRKYSF